MSTKKSVPCDADQELRWYFGVGSETWAGDAGLGSNFGAMLQRAAGQESAKRVEHPRTKAGETPWADGALRGPWAFYKPTYEATTGILDEEDHMIERCAAAPRAANVEARLRALPNRTIMVLFEHVTGNGLPFGISSAAVYTDQARAMCGTSRAPKLDALREVLMVLGVATHADAKALTWEAELLVKDSYAAFVAAEIEPAKRAKLGGRGERMVIRGGS